MFLKKYYTSDSIGQKQKLPILTNYQFLERFPKIISFYKHLEILMGFPGSSVVKNLLASVGDAKDMGLIPGLGRSSGIGNGNPLQYSCLENPHGLRSLVGYSPWGHKESDMTEHAQETFVMLLRDNFKHFSFFLSS